MKKFFYWLGVIMVGIALGFAIQFVRAWTEPSAPPPGGNVGAPLNTSNLSQSKIGSLVLNTGGAATGLIVDKGNVGIGTATPKTPAPNAQSGNLDVNDIFLRATGQWVSQGGGPSYPCECRAIWYIQRVCIIEIQKNCGSGWHRATFYGSQYCGGGQPDVPYWRCK